MSAEKQTLILAGETVPRRKYDSLLNRPLTIVATPADETLLLMQDRDASGGSALIPASRAFTAPASPANAYLRTQSLSARRNRTHLVDTYA